MSRISEAMLTVEELYAKVKSEADYFYKRNKYDITRHYIGMMCAYATVNDRLLGDRKLMNDYNEFLLELKEL